MAAPTQALRSRRWRVELLGVVLALLVLATLLYGQLLVPGQVPASSHSDFIHQHLAIKDSLHRSLAQGQGVPLWRSDQFAGVTAWSNPQAQYTYPLHGLFWLLAPVDAVGPTLWLHLVLAGLALYALGAALQLQRPGRLIMAIGGLVSHRFILSVEAGWLPVLSTMATVPLALAALVWLLRAPAWRPALALALSGGLALVTGGMQLCYYAAIFGVVLVAVELSARWRARDAAGLRRVLVTLPAALALAVGLSAHLWLPLIGEAPLLSRGLLSYAYFLSDTALLIRDWASLLSPALLGSGADTLADAPWERCAYFGLVPLLLAVAGVIDGRRQRWVLALAACALVSLLLTVDGPVLRAVYAFLPGYRLFRGPARILLFTGFFGIALAGHGADAVARLLSRRGRAWPRAILGLCALTMLGEGALSSSRRIATLPRDVVLPDPEVRRLLAQDHGLFRVATIQRDTLNYGWASSFGLQLIHGGDAINYGHYKKYFNRIQQAHTPPPQRQPWNDLHGVTNSQLLDVLGVRYLVTAAALPAVPPELALVARLPGQPMFRYFSGFDRGTLWVYRNAQALPRAFFVDEVIGAQSEDDALERITGAPLATLAVVEAPAVTGPSPPSPGDLVQMAEWRPGALTLEVQCAQPRFVVISEIWHPGWSARIDGASLALAKTDVSLLGAWLPAGRHTLELAFRPRYWHAAWVVNGLAGVMVTVALWRSRRWR